MLKSQLCGVHTGHRTGFVHHVDCISHYLLMVFRTPFFVVIDGKRMDGEAGTAILHRPGSSAVHGPGKKDEQFVNDWIYFTDEDGIVEAMSLRFDCFLNPENPQDFTNLISKVIDEQNRNDEFSERIIDGAIYQMLASLSRSSSKELLKSESLFCRYEEARTQILAGYKEKWTLKKMAALTGYSVSRFSALYTKFFGISPMTELLNQRIEVAVKLLNLHTYKVSEVAEMCGFASVHYFSGFMKRRTGRMPSEY